MGNRKKILQICNYFLGTQLFNALFKRLSDTTTECFTYCPSSDKTFVGWDVEKEKTENTVVSNCFNQTDRFFFKTKCAKIFADIEKHYTVSDFDCIYAHSLFSSGYVAYNLKKKFGTPYAVAVCNTDVNTFFKYAFWLRDLGIKIMLGAEKVVFVSETYKGFVKEKYVPQKDYELFDKISEVIPFGIDDFFLSQKCVHTRESGDKKLNIVSTGRIEPNKNQLTTAKAAELLINDGYDVTLTLIGRTTNTKYLKTLEAFPFVKYAGEKDFDGIKDIYKNADIFVMPSVYETFGLVYGEAMSQGLPVIYSKGQGFDMQFPEGEAGYRVSSDSPEEIKEAILKILGDYNNLSIRASKNSDKFNWNSIAKRYLKIFNDIEKGN